MCTQQVEAGIAAVMIIVYRVLQYSTGPLTRNTNFGSSLKKSYLRAQTYSSVYYMQFLIYFLFDSENQIKFHITCFSFVCGKNCGKTKAQGDVKKGRDISW